MKDILKRILLIGVVQLLAYEILSQLGVHWRESTSELCDIALMLATLVGLIWAVRPSFQKNNMRTIRIVSQAMLVIFSFVMIYAVDYYHSWHLRPNLGIHQDPEWATEHPEFQKEMQARISNNMWR